MKNQAHVFLLISERPAGGKVKIIQPPARYVHFFEVYVLYQVYGYITYNFRRNWIS